MSREMPEDQKKKCAAIIHSAATAAGAAGAGVAQIPLADSALITPIQVTMIIALGKVFDQEIIESTARAIISGAAASFAGRAASQLLLGWIPGVGNLINTGTAASITEMIGWSAANKFFEEQASWLYDSEDEQDEFDEEKNDDVAEGQDEGVNVLLKQRAQEFFSGMKDKKANKEEYDTLLADIEEAIEDGNDTDDSLAVIYQKLLTGEKMTMGDYDLETGEVCFTGVHRYLVTAQAKSKDICVGDKYVLAEDGEEKTKCASFTVIEIVGEGGQKTRKANVKGSLRVESDVGSAADLRKKKFVLQSRALGEVQ